MNAAVVVPAYDEAGTVSRTLDSLAHADAEVVVVAGGTDDTASVADAHPATDRVLDDEAETGPAAARNQGARAVDADVVCFTDADTVVPPGWVARHLSNYYDERVVGVGGPLRPYEGSLRDRALFKLLSDYWYRVSWPVGFVQASTNNCSYRRGALLDAGGFDEALPFMEDTDCSLRMRRHGRMVYDPLAYVETSPRRQHEEGYLSLFGQYAVGYARYALGLNPDPDAGDGDGDGGYFRRL